MSLIQSLSLLLISAHLLRRLAVRYGQPELLGHMLAGLLLGPAVLNWVAANSALNACADLAVLFVVISAGLVDQALFSSLLIVGIVTTLLTPLLLRRWQKQRDPGVGQPATK